MPISNLVATDSSAGVVTLDHLGGNYQFSFSNLTGYSADLNQIGMTALRYPGGTYTERFFDINNPNATQGSYVNHSGVLVQDNSLTGQSTFFNFCTLNNVDTVTMVVPMAPGFTEQVGYWGTPANTDRAVDPDWADDLKVYIKNTLAEALAAGISIKSFELGNEYEAHMTPKEYAKVASASAVAIQQAIDEFINDPLNNLSGWEEPLIAVQVSNEPNAEVSYNRNESVLDNFTQGGLDAIDAVTGHYYLNGNLATEIVEDPSNHYPVLWDAMALWDVETGRDLERLITEWNVFHDDVDQLGLRQIDPILDMFTNFMMNGVDGANLWALQYNQNGMFDVGGWQNGVTVAGNFVAEMIDDLPGMNAVEIVEYSADFNAYAFADDEQAVLYITSLGGSSLTVDLAVAGMAQNVIGSTWMGISSGQATTDPNATWQTSNGYYTFGQSFNLGAYEVLQITLNLNIIGGGGADTLVGTIFADTLTGGAGDDLFHGGEAADFLYGENDEDTLFGDAGDDTLHGGDGDDNLYGGAGDDTLYGAGGDDYLKGHSGDDYLKGHSGNDRLRGGTGDDRLKGGSGDDIIEGDEGADELWGEDGDDLFHGGEDADYLWGEGDDDTLFGDAGDDTLHGGDGDDNLYGGAGDDTLYGAGGDDYLKGHSGDDYLKGHSGNDRLRGGTGDDRLKGGSGDDIIEGDEGADKLWGEDGSDTFVFYDGDGMDEIADYETGIDYLKFDGALWSGSQLTGAQVMQYANVQNGDVVFNFGNGNSVTLEGVSSLSGIDSMILVF